MDDLLKILLEPLVKDINEVEIKKEQQDDNLHFKVVVPKDDIAKVIGKEGKMIKSIKHLLKLRAVKENLYVTIGVEEK